jgi:hypothetical protein
LVTPVVPQVPPAEMPAHKSIRNRAAAIQIRCDCSAPNPGLSAFSVVQTQGPNDHRGQRQHDCNVHQLPATASAVPSMPEVVVNGSNFVR